MVIENGSKPSESLEIRIGKPSYPRVELRDKLLQELNEIEPAYNSFRTIRADRDKIREAGLDWKIIDAIWGQSWPNGDIPLDDRLKELTATRRRYSIDIGNDDNNTRVSLSLNTQGGIFLVEMRPFDFKRPYKNSYLVDVAKDFLGQSTNRVVISENTVESFARTYDLDSEENIDRDSKIARSVMYAYNLIQGESVKI